jgi:hypothetical protein
MWAMTIMYGEAVPSILPAYGFNLAIATPSRAN